MYILFTFFRSSGAYRYLHSFPTRRSSDLPRAEGTANARHGVVQVQLGYRVGLEGFVQFPGDEPHAYRGIDEDRKSTRLNSSHVAISYAVFCLKKKKDFIYIIFLIALYIQV